MFENKLNSKVSLTSSNIKTSLLTTTKSSLLLSHTSLLTQPTVTNSSNKLENHQIQNLTLKQSNENKKRPDLTSNLNFDIEIKKPRIFVELKSDALLYKPIENKTLTSTLLTKLTLVNSTRLPTSSIINSDKPKTIITLKSNLQNRENQNLKPSILQEKTPLNVNGALKRQLSSNTDDPIYIKEDEEFDYLDSESFQDSIGKQNIQVQQKKFKKNKKQEQIDTNSLFLRRQRFDLIAFKNGLVNAVSSSLLREPNFKNVQDQTRQSILSLAEIVIKSDPQFLLKLALYTRRELNIRVTGNFLVCMASYKDECRPFLQRFFKHAIVLPSDWIDIAEQYQLFTDKRINFGSLPSALRKCMVDKFPDFDQYQLAKYNKEKSRLAKNSKIKDVKHIKSTLKDADGGQASADEKQVEEKYIKFLKKGLLINDRIFIELMVKEKCKNLKIDIMSREETQETIPKKGKGPVKRGAVAPKNSEKNEKDLVAVRIGLDYENRRIVQKSFLQKEWSKRTENVNNPKGFDFLKSFESVFFFVDVKSNEFSFGLIKNGNETVLSKYSHSKHNLPLFKLNCLRVSGVDIKLKDLSVISKDLVHMDSQNESAKELEQRSFTLKQLIRQLHISHPVENVMCLIGKKYPNTFEEFMQMKLPGVYDSNKAGKRMKLPTAETWETQISQKGNKAEVWQQLIDNKKLPYMAMLRNLRNMIKCGISEKHHQWVIKKLQDEGAVVYSKQFPFRFFTAYEIIGELEDEFNNYIEWSKSGETNEKAIQGNKRKGANKQVNKFKDMNYDLDILKRYKTALDNALKVATTFNVQPIKGTTIIFINLGYQMRNKNIGKSGKRLGKNFTTLMEIAALFGLMFKYSCENSKLIVFSNNITYASCELQEGTILENMKFLTNLSNLKPDKSELSNYPKKVLVEMLEKKEHIDNLIILSNGIEDIKFQQEFLRKYRCLINDKLLFVNVNMACEKCQLMQDTSFDHENDVCISGFSDSILRFVAEKGNQGQLIHIENIEKAYDISPLVLESNKQTGSNLNEDLQNKISLIERPKFKLFVPVIQWKTVKVFISSTFRDMHSERDLLAKTVFPLLRSKLSALMINIYEVDMRWGITESEDNANKTLDLCLNQVLACDYFIGILGERYGHVLDSYSVRKNPALSWLKEFPQGSSITELEIMTKLKRENESYNKKLSNTFFYFRDNSFIKYVPTELRHHFEDLKENIEKLEILKKKLTQMSYEIFNGYKCKWSKLDESNRAIVNDIEAFGVRVFNNLYNSISNQYKDEISMVELDENVHLNNLTDQFLKCSSEGFVGRASLLKKFEKVLDETKYVNAFDFSTESAVNIAKDKNLASTIILLTGEAGCGKTAFIANFLSIQKNILKEYFVHSVGAYYNSEYITMFLKRFSIKICRHFSLDLDEIQMAESNDFDFFRKTFSIILNKIDSILIETKFYIIIDGVDCFLDDFGNLDESFGWLPERIPPKIVFIFTSRSTSSTKTALSKICTSNKSTTNMKLIQIDLEQLDLMDKSLFVRTHLAKFDKFLDENPFNNQMKLLTGKRESSDPLYLTLACEELRLHGQFETLNNKIKELPIKLTKLINFVLDRLEFDYGSKFFYATFMFICSSRDGLFEQELKNLLELFFSIQKTNSLDLIENCDSFLSLDKSILKKFFSTGKYVKTPKLLSFIESISQSFLKTRSSAGSEVIEIKKNFIIENALKQKLIPLFNKQDKTTEDIMPSFKLIKKIMALYYWNQIDSQFNKQWDFTNPRSYTYLPYYLSIVDLHNDLMIILSDLYFLWLKCENGLGVELMDDFDFHERFQEKNRFYNRQNAFEKKYNSNTKYILNKKQKDANSNNFLSYKLFVMSNYHIIISNPQLLLQQAINQPERSIVSKDVRLLLKTNPKISSCNLFEWLNKSNVCEEYNISPTKLVDFDDAVTCVTISPNGTLVVCGTENCEIKLFSIATANFIRKFQGHSAKINSLVFVDKNTICSTSSDGLASIWNANEGYRIKILNKHNGHVVSGCCAEKNGKSLITVGWDCSAKIWNPIEGNLLGELKHPRPINCITFNPDGNLVATGCWDSCIRIFNYFDRVRKAVLRGHKTSIRSISYSNNGVYLSSSSIDGEVKLWHSKNGVQIATLKGHSMPVNSVCFSPNNKFLITGSSDRRIKVWSGSVGKMIRVIRDETSENAAITSVCFEQNNGQMIAAGTHSGEIRLYEVYTGAFKNKLKAHSAVIRRIKFSSNGKHIISASEDGHTKVIDLSNESMSIVAELSSSNSPSPIGAMSVSKQNLIVNGSDDCNLYVYSNIFEQLNTGKVLTARPSLSLNSHKAPISACSFNENGDRFASASKDAMIIVWKYNFRDFTAQELITINQAHHDWITDLEWSATSDFILTSSNDMSLKIWNALDGTEKSVLTGHSANINSCSFKFGCAVSTSFDGSVKIWSHKGHEITTLYGHQAKVNSCDLFVKLNPKLEPLKVDGNDKIDSIEEMEIESLWSEKIETETLKEPNQKQHRKKNASKPNEFDIEGVYLVTCGDDNTIRIWKPIESDYLISLENHNNQINSIDLSSQDVVASASSDKTVNLSNLKDFFTRVTSGLYLSTERVIRNHYSEITCLSQDENGDILISGSLDGMILIWQIDLEILNEENGPKFSFLKGLNFLLDFKAHVGSCNSICVLSEKSDTRNKYLTFITSSNNESMKVWKLKINLNKNLGSPSIELIKTYASTLGEKIVFMGKMLKPYQNYIVVVSCRLDNNILVKLYTVQDDNLTLVQGGFCISGETSMLHKIKLIKENLYLTFLHNEIIQVDLEKCFKKMQLFTRNNNSGNDVYSIFKGYINNREDFTKKSSNEIWFTALEETDNILFSSDWQGNVYRKDSSGNLLLMKSINQSRTTDLLAFKTKMSNEQRFVSCGQDGYIKIWTNNFEEQLGLFLNSSEVTVLLPLINNNVNNYNYIFGDKMGNLNLLRWYE